MSSMSSHTQGARETLQVVRFYVGGRQYAIDIMQVKEIILPLPIVPVPGSPAFVEGIVELRGAFLPIVDVRKRFGLEGATLTGDSRYLIADLSGQHAALIVDSVLDVCRIPRADIESAPTLARGDGGGFLIGVAKWDGEIAMLIDLHQLLTPDERAEWQSHREP